MNEIIHPLRRFIRPYVTASTNCPGCGNGIAAQAIVRAIDELGMDLDDFIFVTGIGCSAWIPSPFFNVDVLQTTHGRPIAFAVGIKMGLLFGIQNKNKKDRYGLNSLLIYIFFCVDLSNSASHY